MDGTNQGEDIRRYIVDVNLKNLRMHVISMCATVSFPEKRTVDQQVTYIPASKIFLLIYFGKRNLCTRVLKMCGFLRTDDSCVVFLIYSFGKKRFC